MINPKSSLSGIEEKIINYLKNDFVIVDNIQRLSSEEERIILEEKASLLIEAAINSGKFIPFMGRKPTTENNVCRYKLQEPIQIKYDENEDYKFVFDEIYLSNQINSKEKYGLYIKENKLKHYTGPRNYNFPNGTPFEKVNIPYNGVARKIDEIVVEAKNIFKKCSLFCYCKQISPYNTTQKVLRYFHNETSVYSSLKLVTQSINHSCFINSSNKTSDYYENYRNREPELNEETIVQNLIDYFILSQRRSFELNSFFEKVHSGWFKQVYSFKNEFGEVLQKVLKLIDINNQGKCLIPCTAWNRNCQYEQKYFCVPLPKSQILYNLDLLINNEPEAVILTDSIEIADLNQNKRANEIVWSSWLPESVDDFGCIDWTLLNNIKCPIYYLITNHTGQKLEEAYIKANKIRQYLAENQGIDINFIQLEINFNDGKKPYFTGIEDIMEGRLEGNPQVSENSITFLSNDDFLDNLKFANSEIKRNSLPFCGRLKLLNQDNQVLEDTASEPDKPEKKLNYLLRPVFLYGQMHMIFAPPDIGKTSFVLSLCGSIIAKKKPFEHKWWTVPRDKPDNYDYAKVLFIDFEISAGITEMNIDDFTSAYFPQDRNKREICRKNFIYEMQEVPSNGLTNQSEHQKIIDLIENAKNKGTQGQKVDLVVFDSYTKICGLVEEKNSYKNIRPLFKKIINSGTAILIINHTTKDGKAQKGFSAIEQDLLTTIRLSKEEKTDLTKPILLSFEKNKPSFDTDKDKFYIYLSEKKWYTKNCGIQANIKKLINILYKARSNSEKLNIFERQIKYLDLPKTNMLLKILSTINSQDYIDDEIDGMVKKLDLANNTSDTEDIEFIKIITSYRQKKYFVDEIHRILGLSKSSYHEKINKIIGDYHFKSNLSPESIHKKTKMPEQEIKKIIKKLSKSQGK